MRIHVAGFFFLVCFSAVAGTVSGAIISTTVHGPGANSLDGQIAVGDVLSGLIATELPGDQGWHSANPASGDSLNENGLPAFTDDRGDFSGLTGLLNDFPGAGNPAKRVQYDLAAPTDIARIQILSGNAGRDGRIFSTTVINYSIDQGANFEQLGYFQSDPSGTLNNADSNPRYGSTLVSIFEDAGPVLLTGVTNLQFDFYAVDNTGGQMRDPFDGVNPFTGSDDALTAAFVSPLIYEIDAVAVPEPATIAMWSVVALLTGILVWRHPKRA